MRVPASEPYLYVVVRTDAGWNADVRYNLRLRAELPKEGGEVEPNDDPAHAQALVVDAEGGAGALTVAGTLGRGDVDVYKYAADRARRAGRRGDAARARRHQARDPAPRRHGAGALGRGQAARARAAARTSSCRAATALVRLSAGKGDANLDEPYRLTITARPPEPGGEREPNDTIATPTPLPPGAVGGGLIAPRGDVDFWQAPATPDADGNVTRERGRRARARRSTCACAAPRARSSGASRSPRGAAATPNTIATGGEACCLVEVREATGKLANPRDRYAVAVGK